MPEAPIVGCSFQLRLGLSRVAGSHRLNPSEGTIVIVPSMIQLTSAGKRYGPKTLFQDADWLVTPQERVGVVGSNGSGKSSLLKVLAGIESLDSGTISRPRTSPSAIFPRRG